MYIEKIESFMNFLEKRKVVSLYDRNVYILAMRERDLYKDSPVVEELASCKHAQTAYCFRQTTQGSWQDQGDSHCMCESH